MLYFTIITWIATLLQVSFFTLGLAAALYYLAELVEEYTMATGRIIKGIIMVLIGVHIGFLVLEDIPSRLSVVGIVSQVSYLAFMNTFPSFNPFSPSFLASIVLVVVHHYMAFNYFGENFHQFAEIIAYFTLCLWTVPFAFFISLSANDQVLPTKSPNLMGGRSIDDDIVSAYLSKSKKKGKGLLSVMNWAKDSLFPSQQKRFS